MLTYVIFVAAMFAFAVVASLLGSHAPMYDGRSIALRTLEDRLATGEIDDEQYRARRAAIVSLK